jgi:glycosyltransferase involved in cell wall biosynthesis
MGKSLLYIGNSISDGMPNTLLEAIIMGAFPIQSNPGGVTEEIIANNINGLLLNNPEDINEIQRLIAYALNNLEMFKEAFHKNSIIAEERLEYNLNQQKIIKVYNQLS